MTQASDKLVENEPFLAVLEYILIPKYINFYGKVGSPRRPTVGAVARPHKAWKPPASDKGVGKSAWLISNRNQALKGTQWMPWC